LVAVAAVAASVGWLGSAATAGAHEASGGGTLHFQKLALSNGWQPGGYDAGAPGVARSATGMVYLRGALAGGSSDYAATLPAGDRPAFYLYIPVFCSITQDTAGEVAVQPDGFVDVEGAPCTSFTSLDGVSFPSAGTTLHFTHLRLTNGWSSENATYTSGNPKVARTSEGVTYLEGALGGGRVDDSSFSLPSRDRPASDAHTLTYTYGATTGSLWVTSSGPVTPGGDAAADYTSLDGISYPSAHTRHLTTTRLPLQDGWHKADGEHVTAARSPEGIVYLEGLLAGGSEILEATKLPKQDRPIHDLRMPIYTYGGAVGSILIRTTGEVDIYGGSAAAAISSLWGVSFPVAS
jgi:hypothetical protein